MRARVPHRTVERWLSGLGSPSLPHFISMLHAYGPPLLEAAMSEQSHRDMKREGFDWVEHLKAAEDQDKVEKDLLRVAEALKALINDRPNARPGEND